MQVSIHEKGLTLTDVQKDYVLKKIENLKIYSDRIDDESTKVRIDVETNKMKTSNKNITVQVTMFVPHAVIRAEVYSVTIEEGVDLAVDKLKKQIERYKTRQNRRDNTGKWIPASTLEEISAIQAPVPEVSVISYSKKKSFELDPMHEEEAIEQLELLGHKFYAFLNTESERFNVVYKREDESYGLLDFGLSRE